MSILKYFHYYLRSVGLVRSVRSVPQELTYLVTNNREVVGLIVDNLGPPLGILSQLSGTDIAKL